MINKNSFILILVILTILASSCSLLPVSKDTKDILNQVKDSIFQEERFHLSEEDTLNDKKISVYLYKTLNPILKLYNMKDVSIFVADSFEAQALITSSYNEIYISRGMLYAIKNEAELVALLGHEVGHAKLDHLKKEERKSQIPGIIRDTVESATGTSIPDDVEDEAEDIYLSQFNQKKEQEADEFGAITAAKLGYDPYSFANLFDRLNSMSNQNIAIKLRNLLKGSHKTLSERAKYIRNYLESNGIPKSGKKLAKNYLKNVGHLGNDISTAKTRIAQKDLIELQKKIVTRSQNKTPLTVGEFISYINKIRTITKNLNLLSELKYTSKTLNSYDNFMMESVKILKPWWAPQNTNLQMLVDTLVFLGRTGVGTIPFVGDGIDLAEVLTGEDFYSGKPLSFGERVASTIGLIAGSGKAWRNTAAELGTLNSKIIDEKEISKVANVATEAIEESPLLGKTAKTTVGTEVKQVNEIQNQYRLIKNEKNYVKLKELSEEIHSKNIPDDWRVKISRIQKEEGKYQGIEFIHPENDHIRIRVMPGYENAKWVNSQKPYVVQKINGKYIDIDGNVVTKRTDSSHIPLGKWNFKNFWRKNGNK